MSTTTTLPTTVVTAKRQSSASTKTALDNRERYSDHLEAQQSALDGRQAQMHTGMPGSIISYNANTQTAVVQLAIQAIQTQKDGTRKNVTIAPIQDVPVIFPTGGGHTLTFPISAGDECWVAFSQRNIDAWFQQGGQKPPPDWRMHDINDAVCLVGLRNQGRALNPPANNSTTQLRTDDGHTVVQIDGPNQAITLSAGNTAAVVFVDGKDQAVVVQANKNVQIQGNPGGNLGFFNANPVPKPVVTGSKQGNPALTSLMIALRTLGIVTDNTT